MKKFLLNFLIPILTFSFGVGIYRISTPKVSLKTITTFTSFYDGASVEIETYAQLTDFDSNYYYLGDFDEKIGMVVGLDTENSSPDLASLHNELVANLSDKHFKRVKVLVKGTVKDNCKTEVSSNGAISFGCCFGRSITIKAQEVKQLEPVEDYTLPE